jgi:hypothetical protein
MSYTPPPVSGNGKVCLPKNYRRVGKPINPIEAVETVEPVRSEIPCITLEDTQTLSDSDDDDGDDPTPNPTSIFYPPSNPRWLLP